jgi:hypothetical protein
LPEQLTQLFPFVLLAVALGIAGRITPAFFTLSGMLRSYVQHFAAGLLMAIIAVDLLPEVRGHEANTAALAGFAIGAAAVPVTEELLVKGHAAANTATTSAIFLSGVSGADGLYDAGQWLSRRVSVTRMLQEPTRHRADRRLDTGRTRGGRGGAHALNWRPSRR